ncbi:hypothetical protein CIB48_g8889 [Xylaria polymorpha]|nr:hypothetical protein CIB48_g8889 [Xylaria polymorpha]
MPPASGWGVEPGWLTHSLTHSQPEPEHSFAVAGTDVDVGVGVVVGVRGGLQLQLQLQLSHKESKSQKPSHINSIREQPKIKMTRPTDRPTGKSRNQNIVTFKLLLSEVEPSRAVDNPNKGKPQTVGVPKSPSEKMSATQPWKQEVDAHNLLVSNYRYLAPTFPVHRAYQNQIEWQVHNHTDNQVHPGRLSG